MKHKFKEKFDKYVCEHDSISVRIGQFLFTATIERDLDSHIDDDDCFNPDRSVTGCSIAQNRQLRKDREAWFNDEWFFCGIVISASTNGILIDDHLASLWGIEVNLRADSSDYLQKCANELLGESIPLAEKARHEMLNKLIG